jgi:hypothetical protein
MHFVRHHGPILAAARSKAWVCDRSLARTLDSNTAGGMDVSVVCCRVERGLITTLITRPEQSY